MTRLRLIDSAQCRAYNIPYTYGEAHETSFVKRLKIAVIAPFDESVPPAKYGGTEAVVHTLVEELHRQGHDVTLFASGDSKVSCRLVSIVPRATGSGKNRRFREALTYEGLVKVAQHLRTERFDIIHNHLSSGWQALLFKDWFHAPIVTTTHGMLTMESEAAMYRRFKDSPFVSISNAQRVPLPELNYVATVYHGLDLTPFTYSATGGSYLAFLGRFVPGKGPVEAIEVARRTGKKLIMAAKIDDFEREYYETSIKPHIDGKQIVFLGEVDLPGKVELLRNAAALINPVRMYESFGLTNIEAMAVGTPVIGLRSGSLPEIIDHEKTGYLCNTVDEMVEAVGNIQAIDRAVCRKHVEEHFTAERMANDYVAIYRRLAEQYEQQRRVHVLSKLLKTSPDKRRVSSAFNL